MRRLTNLNKNDVILLPNPNNNYYYRFIDKGAGGDTVNLGVPIARLKGNFISGGVNTNENTAKAQAILANKNNIKDFSTGTFPATNLNLDEVVMFVLEGVGIPEL